MFRKEFARLAVRLMRSSMEKATSRTRRGFSEACSFPSCQSFALRILQAAVPLLCRRSDDQICTHGTLTRGNSGGAFGTSAKPYSTHSAIRPLRLPILKLPLVLTSSPYMIHLMLQAISFFHALYHSILPGLRSPIRLSVRQFPAGCS